VIGLKPFEDFPDYEDGSIEAGLWMLAMISHPNEEWTLEAIAEACGVSFQAIHQIEQKALSKMRKELSRRKLTGNQDSELELLRGELTEERAAMDERSE
jgi:hypothetical protein